MLILAHQTGPGHAAPTTVRRVSHKASVDDKVTQEPGACLQLMDTAAASQDQAADAILQLPQLSRYLSFLSLHGWPSVPATARPFTMAFTYPCCRTRRWNSRFRGLYSDKVFIANKDYVSFCPWYWARSPGEAACHCTMSFTA